MKEDEVNWGDPPLHEVFFFEGHIVPTNAGQHNLREGRRPALFKLLKEVRVSECQMANDT